MRKYSETHEWVDIFGDVAIIGISSYAQKELGEVVYLKLPEIGQKLQALQESAVLESTKAAADIYCPISGEVVEVNTALLGDLEKLNLFPEGQGWLFKVKITNSEEIDALLEAEEYRQLISV